MQMAEKLSPQYLTDKAGRKTAVLLTINEYTALLEDLADLATVAERVNEPTVPHAKVVAELRDDGYSSGPIASASETTA